MRLPRRQAQGEVPRAVDPALEVAGGRTMGQVIFLDAANQVYQHNKETTQLAERAASFHTASAETQAALDEWTKQVTDAGRFMTNEHGEQVPTHTVVVDAYDKMTAAIRGRVSGYTKRLNADGRSHVESEVEKLLAGKRGEVLAMQRDLFVSDVTATYDDNLQIYLGARDYEGAAQMVRDYFDAGIFTAEKRATELSSLRNRFALSQADDLLASASTTTDYRRAMEYVQDPEISAAMTPAQRSTLIERALTGIETVDTEADKRLTDRQNESASKLESLMIQSGPVAITWDDIQTAESTGNISPKHARDLRSAKRTMAGTGYDDDQTVKWLEAEMFRLSEAGNDFEDRRERMVAEIYRNSASLSAGTFNRVLGQVRQLDGQRFSSPTYRQAEEFLKGAIMSIPAGFTVFADEATARKTDAYNAASAALFRAAQSGGPDFDALEYVQKNIESFKGLAAESSRDDPPPTAVMEGGTVNVEATQEAWNQLLLSGELTPLEHKARTDHLVEYMRGRE